MPSRLVCVALLFYWLVAAAGLISRDLLPELSIGAPPDLRTIAGAGGLSPPARWNVLVVDNPKDPESARAVGQAVTRSRPRADGGVEMSSTVVFDSGQLLAGLLKGAFRGGPAPEEKIEFVSVYQVDRSGNLRSFQADVRLAGQSEGLWRINGVLKNRAMQVVSRGPLPILNRTASFPYEDRAVVQSQFGPLDRLPGLAPGQRWDERVASPLSGQVETVRAEVARDRPVIHWNTGPVKTLEVVHRSKAATAHTWVRPDGLVLRQEVVFPMFRLRLERLPDPTKPAAPASAAAHASGGRG